MFSSKNKTKFSAGFSLVEALLALGFFMLISATLVGALAYAVQSAQVAGANSRAVLLAEEGLEAARNLRDASYSGLTAGTYGLTAAGVWALSGVADVTGIFNRHLDIADSGSYTKIVTSTVSYNTGLGTSTVSLTTQLTNWQRTLAALGGLLVYGDGTTSTKYRSYDVTLNTFGTETAIATNASGNTFVVRTSPIGQEAIAGFVTAAGVLNIMCYDGSSWQQEWTTTVGGTGTTRRFDIAYETATGDALVLYSNNVANNNELGYRTKLGSTSCGSANWSANTNYSVLRTAGIIQWVKLAWDKRAGQNLIAAQWADASADLSAMIWNGSTWGNEPALASETNLDFVTTIQDVDNFDLEYESVSGDVMMIWSTAVGNNVNGVRYRVCTDGTATCAWGAVATPPTFTDDAVNLDISANPNSDEMIFASIGTNQSDLQVGYWSGSTWTNSANTDTSAQVPVAGSKLVATGWLISGATTRALVVYNDSGATTIRYRQYNPITNTWVPANGSSPTIFTPSPVFNNPQRHYQIEMNPLSKDQLMFCLSDNASDLFCKRLVMDATPTFTWTNSDGGALELTLPQAINSPYSFAWWRN